MKFDKWIDTFMEEKGVDLNEYITVTGPTGYENHIAVGALMEFFKSAPTPIQKAIKNKMVQIDFVAPGKKPVMDFLKHAARGVAI